MKKIRIMVPALVLAATVSQASVIGFGQDEGTTWSASPTNTNLGISHSRSVTADDITFTITLENSLTTSDIGYRQDRDNIGLTGDNDPYGGNADGTIAQGEGTLSMTLALSGSGVGDLTSLRLNDLWIKGWGNGEVLWFDDGATTVTNLTGDYEDHLDYTGAIDVDQDLGALTALTKDNTGSWELGMTYPTGVSGTFALGAVNFEYTLIPEPATLALLGLGAAALALARRRGNTMGKAFPGRSQTLVGFPSHAGTVLATSWSWDFSEMLGPSFLGRSGRMNAVGMSLGPPWSSCHRSGDPSPHLPPSQHF